MKDINIRGANGVLAQMRGELMKDIRSGSLVVMTEVGGEVTINWDNVLYVSEIESVVE